MTPYAWRTVAVVAALLIYWPAKYIWDISEQHTRGLWSALVLLILVAVVFTAVTNLYTKDPP